MATDICTGATLMCSFGVAPSSLVVLPTGRVLTQTPSPNLFDQVPILNVASFGACTSLSNPSVASATSAALGVLTPMPCVPVIATPWTPGCTKVMNGGLPAVNSSCQLTCSWGGAIQVLVPGQFTVDVS
ncbi:DUF4280 domain-containing protein [Haliangium ochraceum]|uniref:DUF4280 domain-containing protein n=1 Tax=Haliangium ochraceum (strain DSM 14365 / JCM 11303 / SMP-2) TaxID=502025 RepID=D0LR39_HALO1|nr:DUF4280 domain-containing protein [Haliangium ochraceum]ACY15547.1 conserved hypothetical protein [Haliangium ochraceum DSM 14365]